MLCGWEDNCSLAEINGSLAPGGWIIVTCGLTACTSESAPGLTLGNEYGKPLPFFYSSSNDRKLNLHHCRLSVYRNLNMASVHSDLPSHNRMPFGKYQMIMLDDRGTYASKTLIDSRMVISQSDSSDPLWKRTWEVDCCYIAVYVKSIVNEISLSLYLQQSDRLPASVASQKCKLQYHIFICNKTEHISTAAQLIKSTLIISKMNIKCQMKNTALLTSHFFHVLQQILNENCCKCRWSWQICKERVCNNLHKQQHK